jgi:hypothetical protein
MSVEDLPHADPKRARSRLAAFGCPLFIIGFVILLIVVALLLF